MQPITYKEPNEKDENYDSDCNYCWNYFVSYCDDCDYRVFQLKKENKGTEESCGACYYFKTVLNELHEKWCCLTKMERKSVLKSIQ